MNTFMKTGRKPEADEEVGTGIGKEQSASQGLL